MVTHNSHMNEPERLVTTLKSHKLGAQCPWKYLEIETYKGKTCHNFLTKPAGIPEWMQGMDYTLIFIWSVTTGNASLVGSPQEFQELLPGLSFTVMVKNNSTKSPTKARGTPKKTPWKYFADSSEVDRAILDTTGSLQECFCEANFYWGSERAKAEFRKAPVTGPA